MISTYTFEVREVEKIGPYLLTVKFDVIYTKSYCIHVYACMLAVEITFVRTMHRAFAG